MRLLSVTRITVISLVLGSVAPPQLLAQHARYRIIDLGTLGGPNSYQLSPGQSLNNRGQVIGVADTAVADPCAPNCLQFDCFVAHAFRWEKGVSKDLGTPIGVDSTSNGCISTWITEDGLIAELSENGLIDPLTGFQQVRAVFWNELHRIEGESL